MEILVIGAGNRGSGFVTRLHAAGHQVTITSRTATKAAALAAQCPGVRAIALDHAAQGQALGSAA